MVSAIENFNVDVLIGLWRPALEILAMGVFFYYVFGFIRGTRAVQVLKGLVVLISIFVIARQLHLDAVNWLITKIFPVAMLALIVIFQPELRRALARLGANPFLPNFARNQFILDAIAEAAHVLSLKRTGALMAIEDEVGLKNYIESGVDLDAKVSSELLLNIFHPNTPLHDGGVIIQQDHVAAASCLFPLSQRSDLSKTLGTRHRAALGLSEETDAVVVIVSEETGLISVAMEGRFIHEIDKENLKKLLGRRLIHKAGKKGIFQRKKNS